MLGWNLAAAAALGWLGAALARRRTGHALWGLAFVAYPGFVLVLARDLADLLAAALLLAGILALDRQRPVLAAATLTLAGLTRESTLVVPLALAVLWTVAAIWRRPTVAATPARAALTVDAASERPRVQVVTFAVPLGVILAWQLVLWRTWGVAPLAQGSQRLGLPFAGIWDFTRGALQFGAFPLVVRFAELVFVVAAAAATAWSLPRSRALLHEKLAWALGLLVAVLLSRSVWVEDWAFLRAFAEPYLLGTLVLLGRPDRRGLPIFVAGAVLCLSVAALTCAASRRVGGAVADGDQSSPPAWPRPRCSRRSGLVSSWPAGCPSRSRTVAAPGEGTLPRRRLAANGTAAEQIVLAATKRLGQLSTVGLLPFGG